MATTFTADEIRELLGVLELRLRSVGVEAKLFVVGGAAMALAYDVTRVTGDIDGQFVPRDLVLEQARSVARERGLPDDWLNDAVTQMHMPPTADSHPHSMRIGQALTVEIASADYLLAMKAMSSRFSGGDLDDAVVLCRRLTITTTDEIETIVRRYFGTIGYFGAQELWFERIIDAL
ncbi:hypothetical protein HH308_04345 [Gordonia sp. TBRC 11910]|uniref:Nucleotidyl transferase AbiEii toxin, Type IV TA system n=1 Tax=Gordonia asplenii TaxID=2725283 RepID=A0A848KQD2_9ACTN|nr:hypothetical protein [Gordonia asplenii]NMO00442.1 hypothetical protein [Gordonia asplenii]